MFHNFVESIDAKFLVISIFVFVLLLSYEIDQIIAKYVQPGASLYRKLLNNIYLLAFAHCLKIKEKYFMVQNFTAKIHKMFN